MKNLRPPPPAGFLIADHFYTSYTTVRTAGTVCAFLEYRTAYLALIVAATCLVRCIKHQKIIIT